MNPNDNQARLQVLQSTNPSLRAAVAPTPQPTIMTGGNNPNTTISVPSAPAHAAPSISLPDGSAVPSNAPDYTAPVQSQPPDVLGTVGNFVKDAIMYAPNAFKSVTIDPAQALIAQARGDKAGYTDAMNNEMNDNPFAPVANAGKQLSSAIYAQSGGLDQAAAKAKQDAIDAWTPVVGNSPAAQAFIDEAGNAAAGDIYNQYLGQEGIDQNTPGWQVGLKAVGTQAGIAAPLAFAEPTAMFNPIKNIYDRVTGNTARAAASGVLSGVEDAGAIQSALNISKEAADFIAHETDPSVIQSVLKELGVRPNGGTIRTLNDAMNTAAYEPSATDNQNQIQPLNPMNPTQSQLPAGWHPDNAPDPVPALENAARSANTPEQFTEYVNSLTGEDKAAATSALNGMTPEEFYKAAGGGTTGPVGTLPAEDQTAIKAAGGTIPETTMHLPGKGIYSRLTPEQAQMLADEVNKVKSSAGDVVHLTAMTKNLEKYAKEVPLEELGKQSPNAAETIARMESTLPPEDIAAIKEAGGELPTANELSAKTAANDTTVASPNSEAATQKAVDEVLKKLPTATRQYNEAAAIRTGERASRAAQGTAAFDTAGGGQAGLYAKMGAHAGEYTKSGFGMDLTPESRDALINSIENNPNLQPYEKLNAQIAVTKLLKDTPTGPTPYEINLLRKAFGPEVGDAVEQAVNDSKSVGSKILDTAGQVAGLPKSIMASGDVSATFRQGAVLASRHPIMAAKAFGQQLRYFFSPKAYEEGMAEIASRPTYQAMLDSKLAVTGTEALDKSEEQFVSNLAEKVPVLGHLVKGSDRAFTGFLTEMRANVFDHIVNSQEEMGNTLTQKDLNDISRVINTASGRGDLGQFLEQHSKSLSTALFSPRLWKSRLDLLNPIYYARLSPVARQEALQSAATFATEAGGILFLFSHVPGVTVDTNPTSADFLKIKYKNERYDILGGLQQNIVLAAREAMNETTNSQTGVTTQLGSTFGGPTRLSVLTDMIQNKENPLLSAASQLLQGKDRGGNPVNPVSTIGQLAVPLPISGSVQTAADFGDPTNPLDLAKGFLINSPDLVGLSAQNYGNIPSKYQGAPNSQGMPSYNGPVQPNMVTDYNGQVVLDKNGKPVTVQAPTNATPDEVKQLVDSKRPAAVKDAYIRTLPEQTQILMKKTDSELQAYVKSGEITQDQFDQIKNIQKTADSVGKGNHYDIPQGANSQFAQSFYSHWNMMDAKDQQAWLKQPADQNSTALAATLNQQRAQGLPEFKPSNELAQLYAKYETDINTHDGSDPSKPAYDPLQLQEQARKFQSAATKLNYTTQVNHIYDAGGSATVKTMLNEGKLNTQDLAKAIELDNYLYSSGLESSLKFSNSFRSTYGFGTPASGGSGGSSSGGTNQRLTSLFAKSGFIPQEVTRPSLTGVPGTTGQPTSKTIPKFSAAMRQNPVSVLKFKAPSGVTPSKGSTRVTIAPYRTMYTRSLGNVAE